MKFFHVYHYTLFRLRPLNQKFPHFCVLHIFLFVLLHYLIYCDLASLSQPHSQPLRDLKCKSGLRSTNKCRPIELIGRCLFEVHIGFGYAYPKRVQKLLVGRSQTLLIYYFNNMFICGTSPLFVFATFLSLILQFFTCLCGCSSTDLSLPDFSKKRKRFWQLFYYFFTLL